MRDLHIEVATSIDIAATAETVWPYLVDWEHLGDWMLEASEFDVTSASREGVGVTSEATIKMLGISARDAIEVTRWEPPHVLEIAHVGRVGGSGVMTLRPTPQGCRLDWVETLRPPFGVAGWLSFRLFRWLFRRTFMRDLGALRRLVEGAIPG